MKKLCRSISLLLVLSLLFIPVAHALTPDEARQLLEELYVDDLPKNVTEQTTVKGMLDALGDPNVKYFTPEEYAKFTATAPVTPAATFEAKNESTGMITCSVFHEDIYEFFLKTITDNKATVRKWIVDLRNCRSAVGKADVLVEAAIGSAALFVGSKSLAFVKNSTGEYNDFSGQLDPLTEASVTVLVNQNTSGPAELFAGILRDTSRGTVIGSRTYGTNTAQTFASKDNFPDLFPHGDALCFPTARFFTSSAANIDQIGVLPNLIIPEQNAEAAAFLLSEWSGNWPYQGQLRIASKSRQFDIDIGTAMSPEYHPAFVDILEALPGNVVMSRSIGAPWEFMTLDEVVAEYAPEYKKSSFTDLAGSPYASEIEDLRLFQMVTGSGDGTFKPKDVLTRAAFCALLTQALGYEKTEGPSRFPDVPKDAWYTPYVNTLTNLGILNGWDDGLFHPGEPINHQQLMVLLSRTAARLNFAIDLLLQELDKVEKPALYPKYDQWARKYVVLMDGFYYDDAANIDPFTPTTREEAAVCLYRVLNYIGMIGPDNWHFEFGSCSTTPSETIKVPIL